MIRQKSTAGRALARLATATLAALGLVAGLVVATAPLPAAALTGADFNPGFIISDSQFYDNDAMSEPEIQVFLNNMIAPYGGCATWECLAVKRVNTTTRAADRTVCAQYTGASQESTAQIIFKVQQACGISARVLLVTLQKEQSLLTSPAPTNYQIERAMGYACPDTGSCDSQYFGVYNQIYKAAWQLKRYSTPDQWGNYQPGNEYIQYNPNPDCGGLWVNIRNNATAALYNYTPYTPNAASLANLHGSGGSCGAHGNRNFWVYYSEWFGNPTGVVPNVTTSRLQGATRFETAVNISVARGAATGGVVYVTNGYNYPDALSAAPAATLQGGPLLLIDPNTIPPVVKAELTRLAPRLIVVVGGETMVSAATYNELAGYATTIRRDGGADRYDTSRIIASAAFDTSTLAYIATGAGFADALSASAAAGAKKAPVVLVDGTAPKADDPTIATLRELGVTTVIIAGGPVAVSDGVMNSLTTAGFAVTRLGGPNRFAVASALNRNAFTTSPTVYLASGLDFPDALAGSVLAGSKGSALYLAAGGCVFRQTAQDIIDLKATSVVLLGGTNVLGSGLSSYPNCD
jgi:putative cell wall-binding protein